MLKDLLGYFRGESRESRTSESSQGEDVPDIEDDQPRNPYDEIQILQGHSDLVHLLTRVCDDKVLTAGQDNAVFVWCCKSGQFLFSLEGHQKPILFAKAIKFNAKRQSYSDDEYDEEGVPAVVTVSSDKFLMVNISGRAVMEFESIRENILGKNCNFCSHDSMHEVWNLENGCRLKTVKEHGSVIKFMTELKWDTRLYCSGGKDICLWDSGMNLIAQRTRTGLEYIQCIVPVKDNKIVVSTDKPDIFVYEISRSESGCFQFEINPYKEIKAHRESITGLIALSDSMFASASLDGTIVVWTSYLFSPTKRFNHHDTYLNEKTHAFTFSVRYFFALEQRYIFASIASGFAVFDPITDRCLVKNINAHHAQINHMTLVNDGYLLATCSTDGTVRLWGSPSPTMPSDVKDRKGALLPLERLVGRKIKDLKDIPVSLELIGECAGHSGSVQHLIECGSEGFVSSGTDGLLILWKDGALLRDKRDRLVKKIVSEIGLFDH